MSAEILALVPPVLSTKSLIRAKLTALIAACTDVDVLKGPLAVLVSEETKAGHLFDVRADTMAAVQVRAKELTGRKPSKAEMELLIPPARRAAGAVTGIAFDEMGLTERLEFKHGKDLRYTADSAAWYRYDGSIWKQEPSAINVVELARVIVAEDMPAEVLKAAPDMQETLLAEAFKCRPVRVAKAAVEALAGVPGIVTDSSAMDSHPGLLCVQNGTIDLRTGALLPSDPALLLTMSTGCDYDPVATAPVFEQTLNEVFKGDSELVGFFQRLMGYALLANPKERLLVVPYGGGKNGKSTIFNAIERVMGTHAGKIQAETIAVPAGAIPKGDGSGADPALVKLQGKRVIFSEEIKRGSTFNDASVKKLASGGDKLQARNLHSNNLKEFSLVGTIFAPTNVLPKVYDDDNAVWDRLLLLPFTARFDTPDLERNAKLAAEQEGILAWMVAGAVQYQSSGLQVPERLVRLKAMERSGSNLVNMFLEDECETFEGYRESTDALFSAWRAYAELRGDAKTAPTAIALGRTVQSQGYEAVRFRVAGKENPVRGFRGLRLKDGVRLHELQESFSQLVASTG